MSARPRVPIRIKILLALLIMLMLAVGAITGAMANLFHQDKTTYIHDLTSVVVDNAAGEAQTLVESYVNNLQLLADVLFDAALPAVQKRDIINSLFTRFPELVAVAIPGDDPEPLTVFDNEALDSLGIDPGALRTYAAAALAGVPSARPNLSAADFAGGTRLIQLLVPYQRENGAPSALAAWVGPERLGQVAAQSDAFQTAILDKDGVVIAPVASNDELTPWDTAVAVVTEEQRQFGGTFEFVLAEQGYIGGYEQLGIADLSAVVAIPKSAVYLTARHLLRNLVIVGVSLVLLTALAGILVSRGISGSLERLMNAAREIGRGNFNISVKSTTNDEIGSLSESFNQMAGELQHRDVALKGAQEALVQSEKMAAFGQLGAGIAHEVKNPLAGILGYAQLGLRKLEDDHPLRKNFEIIEKETRRCTEIISNLLRFARQDKAEQSIIDVNAVVRDAIDIVDHQITLNQITIDTDLAEKLPAVYANANQLQQVVMNLAINAQQAMKEEPGVIRFTTRSADGHVVIVVEDDGPGIPDEIQAHIFEPFFTTKEAGKGTGLGLSVTYGIVRDHGGTIQLDSRVGAGTKFIISLPESDAERAAA